MEGTCDELGRRSTWILLDANGPKTLTLAWDPFDVETPSQLAERLPKVLIHRNIPGEPIYELLKAADEAWAHTAGWAPHGPRIRWREARKLIIAQGIPLHPIRRRIRDCVLTVDWDIVSPKA